MVLLSTAAVIALGAVGAVAQFDTGTSTHVATNDPGPNTAVRP
jgi:hypothetical protein